MEPSIKKKVLCIDDNHDDCELLIEILCEYDVLCVDTLTEGCRQLGDSQFDLVIVDAHLPDGSGLGLCGQIGKLNARTPVLIVTGDVYITTAEAVEAGAKAIVTKSKVTYFEELQALAGQYARSAAAG
jgi:two-component system KDP operon response regulator KdpE